MLLLHLVVMMTAAINQLRCLRVIIVGRRMIVVVEIVGASGCRCRLEETARIET